LHLLELIDGMKKSSQREFEELLNVIERLRRECPWDKKQTFETLRHLTIEEVFELSETILEKDYDGLKEELGDIIMHVVFYASLAKENDLFDIADVLDEINRKLIRRHPHVFGTVAVKDEKDVLENWEKIKLTEGKKSVLEGIPRSLPPINKAYRVQEKVSSVGFDWSDVQDVLNKVQEEFQELKEEIKNNDRDKIKEELGDLLFSVINLARFLSIDPEEALEQTNKKFIQRFKELEIRLNDEGKSIVNSSLGEMDDVWNKIKKEEKTNK